jgi:uncharacterized protein YjbI with pentapeptide repeats
VTDNPAGMVIEPGRLRGTIGTTGREEPLAPRTAAPEHSITAPQLALKLPAGALPAGALHDEDILRHVLLTNVDIGGQEARDVVLEQVHWQRGRLQGARLTAAHLRDVRFSHCDLSQAVLDKAALQRAEMMDCRLTGLQANEARFQDLLLRNCQGQYVGFAGSVFKGVRFEHCILRDASFLDADLTGALFLDCDLTNADMLGARLVGADLRGSTIAGLRVGLKEIQGLKVDLGQAGALLQGLGATVILD